MVIRHRTWSRTAFMQLGIGMAVLVAALSFLAYRRLAHNLGYYIATSELLAKSASAEGQQFTLGGQVRARSQSWNKTTHTLNFVSQDPKGKVRNVVGNRLPPPLFRSGIGAVVQGTYRNRVFYATAVMIKHSATYVAPKPGQLPQNDQYVNSK